MAEKRLFHSDQTHSRALIHEQNLRRNGYQVELVKRNNGLYDVFASLRPIKALDLKPKVMKEEPTETEIKELESEELT